MRQVPKDLKALYAELQTLQWIGADKGWDAAIDAVSARIALMLTTPAPIHDHLPDAAKMVVPDGSKVAAWCMTDFPSNITTSPEVCASWHRQLFNVAPLYLLAASPSAKGGE